VTVGPGTRGTVNVLLGWLGLQVPPVPKHRRKPHRKTDGRRTPRLIQRLEAGGCQPRQVAEGQWFALCPTCHSEGRHATVEIRRADDGTLLVCCAEAHGRGAA
jgi:hypothetical protein